MARVSVFCSTLAKLKSNRRNVLFLILEDHVDLVEVQTGNARHWVCHLNIMLHREAIISFKSTLIYIINNNSEASTRSSLLHTFFSQVSSTVPSSRQNPHSRDIPSAPNHLSNFLPIGF